MNHGTRHAYKKLRCRCAACVNAERVYQRNYRASRRRRLVADVFVHDNRFRPTPAGNEGATRLDEPPVLTALRSPVAYACDTCGTGFADRRTFTTHTCTGDAA